MKSAHGFLGQSLAEYGLISATIGIVSLGALVLLGQSTVKAVKGAVTPPPKTMNVAASSISQGTQGHSSPLVLPNAKTSDITLTLNNGQKLELKDYPADLAPDIQTAGGNGTTELLLANLDSIISHIQTSEPLTPEQSNALLALAAQGHRVGSIEKVVEDGIAQSKGNATYLKQPSITDTAGKLQSVHDMAIQIGFGGNEKADQPESLKLRTLLDQAVASGALKDPIIKQAVNTLVEQITDVANGVETATTEIVNGNYAMEQYSQRVVANLYERDGILGLNTQKSLLEMGASVVTHQDSSQICAAGNGQDSGTECQAAQLSSP